MTQMNRRPFAKALMTAALATAFSVPALAQDKQTEDQSSDLTATPHQKNVAAEIEQSTSAARVGQINQETQATDTPTTEHQQAVTAENLSDSATQTAPQGDDAQILQVQSGSSAVGQESDATAERGADLAAADGATAQTPPYSFRASDLLGAEVENAQDEDIGEIDDLVIGDDAKLHAVLSVGGFLGIGDRRVVVPYDELKIYRDADDGDEIEVVYDASKTDLEGKEAFSYREGDMSWRERVQDRMGEWKDKAAATVKKVTE